MNLALELNHERQRFLTRRWFFQQCGLGLGSVALASLLGDRAGAANPRGDLATRSGRCCPCR